MGCCVSLQGVPDMVCLTKQVCMQVGRQPLMLKTVTTRAIRCGRASHPQMKLGHHGARRLQTAVLQLMQSAWQLGKARAVPQQHQGHHLPSYPQLIVIAEVTCLDSLQQTLGKQRGRRASRRYHMQAAEQMGEHRALSRPGKRSDCPPWQSSQRLKPSIKRTWAKVLAPCQPAASTQLSRVLCSKKSRAATNCIAGTPCSIGRSPRCALPKPTLIKHGTLVLQAVKLCTGVVCMHPAEEILFLPCSTTCLLLLRSFLSPSQQQP